VDLGVHLLRTLLLLLLLLLLLFLLLHSYSVVTTQHRVRDYFVLLKSLHQSVTNFFSVALRPNAGHGLLILEGF
jgi:uncharacterized membrane protein